MFEIAHISDTHGLHNAITGWNEINPDVVIHSGDATYDQNPAINSNEMFTFLDWYGNLRVRCPKIYVPGNHDVSIEQGFISKKDFDDRGIILLINSSFSINGKVIWGSPFSPSIGKTRWAYNYRRCDGKNFWHNVPQGIDILVTHGPPRRILDKAPSFKNKIVNAGCFDLLNKVTELRPKAHLFGHIHENNGIVTDDNGITYSNAACVDNHYNFIQAINLIKI